MAKVPADTAEDLSDHNQASTTSYFPRVGGIRFPSRVWSFDIGTRWQVPTAPKKQIGYRSVQEWGIFSQSSLDASYPETQNPMDLGDKAIVINSLSSLQLIFLTSHIYLKPIDFFSSFQKRELCKFLKSGHYSKNRDPKSKYVGLVLCSAA